MLKTSADYIIDKLAGRLMFMVSKDCFEWTNSYNTKTIEEIVKSKIPDFKSREENLEEYLQRHNNNNTTEI